LHHVDRIRAGGGNEPDRDLVPICHRCHVVVHKVEYALAAWGVTLRASTWLIRHTMLPIRLAKRLFRLLRAAGAATEQPENRWTRRSDVGADADSDSYADPYADPYVAGTADPDVGDTRLDRSAV
nr:HNH endonuclease signature motif containing protein [Micromonospora sp. DSM 115978]